ncbi:3-ketoacyl-CoA thiolase 2 peroxisomal [Zea mays]|uniref:3-ketoacyl-CoA thiolase 2 peroxisomal n=1 Tax=Zea mays TaxID=4577 RepID=A0A1D6KME0_MAIZE|nr:3-ketoacyl-CoA thiolase 2 peroxisomal [Zea mays]
MSINSIAWEGQVYPKISAFQKAHDCLLPMGITSENVAHRYGVTRQEQDQAALDFSLSLSLSLLNRYLINQSNCVGNSSQVSEGAGVVVLMKRSMALKKGLPILGVFRSFAAVGVDPAIMGIGPVVAILAAVKSAGLEIGDIDLFELNEAFASQFVYCCNKLGLDRSKVNVNGGAIFLGHPLGAIGVRCVATLLNEMKRRGRDCKFGVVTMCIG